MSFFIGSAPLHSTPLHDRVQRFRRVVVLGVFVVILRLSSGFDVGLRLSVVVIVAFVDVAIVAVAGGSGRPSVRCADAASTPPTPPASIPTPPPSV